jgi:hypothetical protein
MDDLIQRIIDLIRRLEEAIDRLRSVINATLAAIPFLLGWIADRVRDGWTLLMDKLQEFWDMLAEFFSYVGDPIGLSNAATTWREDIGGRASNLARDIEDADLAVDDTWSGRAADQYRQGVPSQRDALDSLDSDFAANVAEALEGLRTAIFVFWGAVVAAIITIVAGFAVATGEAVTVFGIPLAPPTALAGLAVGAGAVGLAVMNLYNQGSSSNNRLASTSSGVRTWPRLAI